jgi:hypothetical protein
MAKKHIIKEISKEKHSNKVFETLLSLGEKDHKNLLKYLRSPYFVQTNLLDSLCQVFVLEIKKGHKAFNRFDVWEKIMPNVEYDDVNFRKHCSDLLKHVKNFMAHESLSGNSSKTMIETFNFITDHKIDLIAQEVYQDTSALFKKDPYKPLSHFFYSYLI